MINASNEFLTEMQSRTDFKPSAVVTLSDNTVLPLTSEDFTLSNNGIVDGAGESTFPLGIAIEKSIQLEIANDDGKYSAYDFREATIVLNLLFELSESVESIECGKFTVVEPYTRGATIIINAVDDMYKADMDYTTSLIFPATIGAILRDSCSATGLILYSSDFANNDFIVDEKPEGITHRQLIGYISMIAGGNARINRFGQLEVMTYNLWKTNHMIDGGTFLDWDQENTIDGGSFNPWTTGIRISGGDFSGPEKYHVLSEWLNNPRIDTDDIVITGVQTTYTENEADKTLLVGEEGYVIKIENPLIAGKEQMAVFLISENILGATFRQFEGDHVSYPLAEFMDAVVVVDRDGNTYNSFVTDIDFTFLGMTTFKNSSETALRNGRTFGSAPAEVLRKTKKLVAYEKSEREKAVKNLAEALANSSGLYVTSEEQEDGSTIYYMHNKSVLSESDIIWKYTSEAFAVSTDGGETYPYGFSVTGDMITKILSTEGINADWINAGALSVKDEKGNIIFSVDIDTNTIIISGDSVKIGEKTASQAVKDASDTANKALELANNPAGALTPEEIFNLLTDNGTVKGIYKEGNQIFISFTYAKGGNLVLGGANNGSGVLEVYDTSGNLIGKWDKDGISTTKGTFSGTVTGSIVTGSKFETKNDSGTERVVVEGGGVLFYSNGGYTGRIYPSVTTAPVGNYTYSFDTIVLKSEENCVIELYAGSDKVMQAIPKDGEVVARAYFPLYVSIGQALEVDSEIIGYSDLIIDGDFTCYGTKSRSVNTENYGSRLLYCYETPSPFFGDIGSGVINENGFCSVSIDDMFSESVNCNIEYHVFLQKEGQGDLWIESKDFTHFVVKGTPNLPFSWEIKAIQRDYETRRLEDVELISNKFNTSEEELLSIAEEELLAYENELEELG